MPYWVYVLRSIKDGKLYTGSTADLTERLKRHNEGRERSTKRRAPFELVYFEEYATRGEATRRERYFKTSKGGKEKEELIARFPEEKLKRFEES